MASIVIRALLTKNMGAMMTGYFIPSISVSSTGMGALDIKKKLNGEINGN
jgi:hypothetical protein